MPKIPGNGASRGADLSTLKILHFDVCEYHGEVRHEDAAGSGDFIAGSGWEVVVKCGRREHPPVVDRGVNSKSVGSQLLGS